MNRLGFAAGVRCLFVASLFCLGAMAQDTEHEKDDKEQGKGKRAASFDWKKHPTVQVGDWLRVDFRARFQMDWVMREPETRDDRDLFEFARKRVGAEGTVFKIFEFEFSRELNETNVPWKDAYGNVRIRRWLQVRGGRFRIPFSLDQLTGPTNLDFIDRSRQADRLAPNRDTGVMAHGSLIKKGGLKYQFGYFFNDGDNAITAGRRTGEGTWAGRLTGQPLPRNDLFGNMTFGAAFTRSNVPEGLFSLNGRTTARETFFPRYFVNGARTRIGTEFSWKPGPFGVQGEFTEVREERRTQGLRREDLSDLLSRGWYLQGTWVITGQSKNKGLMRGRFMPFTGKHPFGAVELAIRNEVLRFGSTAETGNPSRSLRANNIRATSDRAWTFGVNWYVNQWIKAQANFTREQIEDTFRAPIAGTGLYWAYKFRLQLAL